MTRQVKNVGKPSVVTQVKDYVVSHKCQIAQMLLVLLICGSMINLQVFAAGGASDIDTITGGIKDLVKFVKKIVIVIIMAFALYGGITLVLGFAQENPDGQSRGSIKFLIGGIIIASVGAFIRIFFGGTV